MELKYDLGLVVSEAGIAWGSLAGFSVRHSWQDYLGFDLCIVQIGKHLSPEEVEVLSGGGRVDDVPVDVVAVDLRLLRVTHL